MKARDIIPGWPRGRTTVGGRDLAYYEFFSWPWPSRFLTLEELDQERKYHEGQQSMVNSYFEEWRLQFPNPPRNEFFERISQMAEAYLVD